MAYLQNIEDVYSKLYKSKQANVDNNTKQVLAGLDTQENEVKNKYTDLMNTVNARKQTAQQGFYNDRNAAAQSNVQSTQSIKDYMAKNNLMSSGENVDAMLRAETNYNNAKGNIYSNEQATNREYDSQLGSADREQAASIADILNKRRLASEGAVSELQSYQDELDAKKLNDINAYNLQLEQQAQKLAAASRSSSGRSSSKSSSNKKDPSILKLTQQEFDRKFTDGTADQWLNENAAEMRSTIGDDEYFKLVDKVNKNKQKLSYNKRTSYYQVGAGAAGRQLISQ